MRRTLPPFNEGVLPQALVHITGLESEAIRVPGAYVHAYSGATEGLNRLKSGGAFRIQHECTHIGYHA